MNIFRLTRTYKSAIRLQRIINVFILHGFGRIVDQIHLGRYIPFRNRLKAFGQWPALKGPSVPERLRMAFEELGPSFIKLAQILSSRPDLITTRYADELRKLQDEVPPFPAEEAKGIIEHELKSPVRTLFREFGVSPSAAASIAQVHNAVLADGREVIVKVQRPAIKETINEDIDIITTIADLMERHIPETRFFNPTGIVSEFSRTVRKELDFSEEGRNCLRIRRSFADSRTVHIPEVMMELTTERVLVMERIRGVRIDEAEKLDRMGLDRKVLTRNVVDAYLKMILEDGFFHADPHPGNIFITSEGQVCFMDFGIVGMVSEETKEVLASTFEAILKKDYDSLVDNFITLGYLPDETDRETFKREFKADLMDLLEPLYGRPIKEFNIARYLDVVFQLAGKHGLRIPSDLLLIEKTLFLVDNIIRQLDPEFDFIAAVEPYAKSIIRKRMSPAKALERTARELAETANSLILLPKEFRKVLLKALKDDMRLKVSLTGLEQFIRDMDRSSNRIAFALVVSAIILSSAIMHAMGTGPKILGLSALGVITFAAALFLGLWLLISIIRSGRL